MTRPFEAKISNPAVAGVAMVNLGRGNELLLDLTAVGVPLSLSKTSTLRITFATNLAAAVVKAMTVSAPGFTARYVAGGWRLTPMANVTLISGKPLAISIGKFQPPLGFGYTNLLLILGWTDLKQGAAKVVDGGLTIPLTPRVAVSGKPALEISLLSAAGGLGLSAATGLIGVTPSDRPALPDDDPMAPFAPPLVAAEVKNQIAFRIQNPGGTPLLTGAGVGQPQFRISLPTVGAASEDGALDALCTDQDAAEITCRVEGDGDESWAVSFDGDAIEWTLLPKNPGVLDAGESIKVVLENVVTRLPPFPTSLFVTWSDLGDYDPGGLLLSLEKVPARPVIETFKSSGGSDPIPAGSSVTLSWNCWGFLPENQTPVVLSTMDERGALTLIRDDLKPEDTLSVSPQQPITRYVLSLAVDDAPSPVCVTVTVAQLALALRTASPTIRPGETVTFVASTYAALSSQFVAQHPAFADGSETGVKSIVAKDAEITEARTTSATQNGMATRSVIEVQPPCSLTYVLAAQSGAVSKRAIFEITVEQPASSDVYVVIGGAIYAAGTNGVRFYQTLPGARFPNGGMRDIVISEAGPLVLWNSDTLPLGILVDTNQDQSGAVPLPDGYNVRDMFVWQQVLYTTSWAPFTPVDWITSGSWRTSCQAVWLNDRWARDRPAQLGISIPVASPRGVMRYHPTVGVLYLADGGALQVVMQPDGAPVSIVIYENVTRFDIGRDGVLYIFMYNALYSATCDATGRWMSQILCQTAHPTSNIAVNNDGVVFWAEDDILYGPMLVRYLPDQGRQVVTLLPGPVDPRGVVIPQKDRAGPTTEGPGPGSGTIELIIPRFRDLTDESLVALR